MSEGTCAVTCNPVDGSHKPGTVGVAVPGLRVAVMNQDGDLLPPGIAGEVVMQGPTVMRGYLNRPRKLRKRSSTDGCTPAISASSTRTAISPSSTAPRTSSSEAVKTSIPRRSSPSSTPTPACLRRPWWAARIRCTARCRWRSSRCAAAPQRPPTSSRTSDEVAGQVQAPHRNQGGAAHPEESSRQDRQAGAAAPTGRLSHWVSDVHGPKAAGGVATTARAADTLAARLLRRYRVVLPPRKPPGHGQNWREGGGVHGKFEETMGMKFAPCPSTRCPTHFPPMSNDAPSSS